MENLLRMGFPKKLRGFSKANWLGVSEDIVNIFYTLAYLHGDCNSDSIDAGAHVGVHTRSLAFLTKKLDCKVVAVEPNLDLHSAIHKQLKAEMLENYELEGSALFTKSGFVEMLFNPLDTQISRIVGESQSGVKAITLLDLTKKYSINPSFVKLDCEGQDGSIVLNSNLFIDKYRPLFSVEIGPWDGQQLLKDLWRKMSDLEYVAIDGQGCRFNAKRWYNENHNQYWNRFLVPNEKRSFLSDFSKVARIYAKNL